MRFINLQDNPKILEISITPGERDPRFTYYYPDGITIKKKTYFVKKETSLSENYYETIEEALKGEKSDFHIKDRIVYKYGEISITLKDIPKSVVKKYKDPKEIEDFLNELSFRYSINYNLFLCFSPQVQTLYEYKELLSEKSKK